MITPTNGRIVWYTPDVGFDNIMIQHDGATPLAAMVTHVWSDRTVNLVVFDSDGYQHRRTSVTLVQDGDPKPSGGRYCEWMPYQKLVAKGEIPPVLHAQPASS